MVGHIECLGNQASYILPLTIAPRTSPIVMTRRFLREVLKLLSDFKRNLYISCIAKYVGKMIGSLYRDCKYFTHPAILCLYKSKISSKMEYRYQIQTGADKSLRSTFKRIQDVSATFWVTNCSPPYNLFPTDETSQSTLCSLAISMESFHMNYTP